MMEEQTKTVITGDGAPVGVSELIHKAAEADVPVNQEEPKAVPHVAVGAGMESPTNPVVAQVAAAGGVSPEKKAVLVDDRGQTATAEFVKALRSMNIPEAMFGKAFRKKFSKKAYGASVAERLATVSTLEELTALRSELFNNTGRIGATMSNQTLQLWAKVAGKTLAQREKCDSTSIWNDAAFCDAYAVLAVDICTAETARGLAAQDRKVVRTGLFECSPREPARQLQNYPEAHQPMAAADLEGPAAKRHVKYSKTNRRPHQPPRPKRIGWKQRFAAAKDLVEIELLESELRHSSVDQVAMRHMLLHAERAKMRCTLVETVNNMPVKSPAPSSSSRSSSR